MRKDPAQIWPGLAEALKAGLPQWRTVAFATPGWYAFPCRRCGADTPMCWGLDSWPDLPTAWARLYCSDECMMASDVEDHAER